MARGANRNAAAPARAGSAAPRTRRQEDETATSAAAHWRDQAARLRRHDRDALPEVLGPPEVFSAAQGGAEDRRRHGYTVSEAETGRNSRTVASRLRMSCAGWRQVPTAEEFYEAVHQPTGTRRETAILLVWYHEAHTIEQLHARLEGAYSWRELARALHRVGLTRGDGARRMNRFARR